MVHPPKNSILLVSAIASILAISCSKDSDLLADYVVADDVISKEIRLYVMDDTFSTIPNSTIVLDVLANDTFTDPDKVKIIETSTPANGIVQINEDKTLTYIAGPTETEATPEETVAEETVTDTFTYTTETVTEENEVVTEQATVTITINEEVTYWKNKFDEGWSYLFS